MRRWVVDARELAVRALTERVILVLGWVLFLVYAFPGFMSYDSVWQLSQARGLDTINDWHPPLMAVIWHYTDSFIAGPFPMLAIQSLSFLVGTYLLMKRFMRPRAAAVVASFVLLVPMNMVVMAVIWKDSQMAGFLVCSIAALCAQTRRGRIIAAIFLFLATAFRYNAAAATLPILVFLWDRREDVWWLRRWAVAAGLWIAITICAFGINKVLTKKHAYPWPTASAPVDIVGVIHYTHHLSDEDILRDSPGVPWVYTDKIQIHAHNLYKPINSFLETTSGDKALISYIQTDEQRAAITQAWKNLVSAHPKAFLRHRLAVFNAQLKQRGAVWHNFVNADWAEESLHYRLQHAPVQLWLVLKMHKLANTELFRVRIYFWLAILLIPLARRNRGALVLLTSGVLYELGLFVVAPAIDYRYNHWMIVSTILAVIVLVASRIHGRVEGSAQAAAAALVPDAP